MPYVLLNDTPCPALLDTGANHSRISKLLAREVLGWKALPDLYGGFCAYAACIGIQCEDGVLAKINFPALLEMEHREESEALVLGMDIFEEFNMTWCGRTRTAVIDFLPDEQPRRIEITRAIRDSSGRLAATVKEFVPVDSLPKLTGS